MKLFKEPFNDEGNRLEKLMPTKSKQETIRERKQAARDRKNVTL